MVISNMIAPFCRSSQTHPGTPMQSGGGHIINAAAGFAVASLIRFTSRPSVAGPRCRRLVNEVARKTKALIGSAALEPDEECQMALSDRVLCRKTLVWPRVSCDLHCG